MKRLLFVLLYAISILYALLVLDIAREYLFEPPKANDSHLKNLWEIFFIATGSYDLAKDLLTQRVFYIASKWSMIFHWIGGPITIILGPLQFIDTIRTKNVVFHKIIGYIYIFGMLFSLSTYRSKDNKP